MILISLNSLGFQGEGCTSIPIVATGKYPMATSKIKHLLIYFLLTNDRVPSFRYQCSRSGWIDGYQGIGVSVRAQMYARL